MGLRPASPLSPTPRSHLEPAGCSARWPRGRRRAPPARRRVFTAQLGQTDKGPDGVRCEVPGCHGNGAGVVLEPRAGRQPLKSAFSVSEPGVKGWGGTRPVLFAFQGCHLS